MKELLDEALRQGAFKAAFLQPEQIILSADFRAICASNQCGSFGRCWMCPPAIGPIDALMAEVRRYPHALLYQTVSAIEDSFDIEGMFAAGNAHTQMSQRLHAHAKVLLKAPFLHLTCGGCHLCAVCAKRANEPCRHPDHALPSLEGYGVDVYRTAASAGLSYVNGQNTVTYFGMILFGECA